MNNELYENVTLEDMPTDDMREIAEICGVDNTVEIMRIFAGLTINVPANFSKKLVDKYIKKNYNGSNMKKICRVCGVSSRYVFKLTKTTADERQMKLFAEEHND